MSFIENKGQWLSNIHFKSELAFGNIYFEKDNFTFILIENEEHNHNSEEFDEPHDEIKGHHFKIKFENANEEVTFSQEDKSGNYYNYFLGNNKDYWASYVHSYKAITYHDLYDGIDMKVAGIGDNMKYDYIVSPFANPSQIQVKYLGIDDLNIKDGNLVYNTAIARIAELKPVVYQVIGEEKVFVECEYKLNKKTKTVQFNLLEDYDESVELVIDPTLVFSSYSGSTLNNFGFTATYDDDGNLFGGGIVYYYNNPVVIDTTGVVNGYPSINSFNLVDSTHGGSPNVSHGYSSDIAISKFSSDGSTLLYSTLIGGIDNEQPQSLVTDTAGNLYIFGRTYSSDFPVTANAYDTSYNDVNDTIPNNNKADIVVLKISSDGSVLLGSTFVGGTEDDGVNMNANTNSTIYYTELRYNYADDGRGEIIVNEVGEVYITSTTKSSDIFSGSTSFQNSLASSGVDSSTLGFQDACVFKLNSDLSSMIWGSYLGGSGNDAGYSIKFDGLGNLFVAGGTNSTDFPQTSGGLNVSFLGGTADGFLAKIDTNGSTLFQSTFLGTPSYDQSYFVEIDEFNNIYTYGQSTGNYIVTPNVYSNTLSSQFIHKLNNDLDSTYFSTVFGKPNSDSVNISPTAFLVDNCSNIYISGWGGNTNKSRNPLTGNTFNLPLTSDALQATTDGSDFYFMVLSKNAESLLYASYFGGNQTEEHVDGGTSRFDKKGKIYQAVCASCSGPNNNFPTTTGAWSQTDNSQINHVNGNTYSTGCNLGVIKMDVYIPPTIVDVDASPTATGCVPLTVIFEADLVNVNLISWDFGDGTTTNIEDPIHVFTDTGTYIIRLIGQDTTLCNLADTAYLSVVVDDDSLVANFIDNTIIDCYNSSVSLVAPNYPTTQYLWAMGDGNTYTTDSVYHEYLNPGDYLVKLLITDSSSCELMDSAESLITILPVIEVDFAISDTFACVPLTVNYTNLTNINVDSLFWSFGDGNTSNLQNPSHNFNAVGTYPIQLIAFDSNSCNLSDTSTAEVVTIDDRVVADIQIDTLFYDCDSLVLRFSSLNGNVTSHNWDFDNGNTSTDSTVVVPFQATLGVSPSIFDVVYIVSDSNLICKPLDTADFRILLKPAFQLSATISDSLGCIPLNVNFNAIVNFPLDSFLWTFGDGNSSNLQNPTNEYALVNTYPIHLIAYDTNTCNVSDTVNTQVVTLDDRVEAEILIDTLFYDCDSLVLRFSALNGNITSYDWDFDNGIVSIDSTIIVSFQANFALVPTIFEVSYIVSDTNSICKPLDTADFRIKLKPEFHFNATISDSSGCLPLYVSFSAFVDYPMDSFIWDFGDGNTSDFLGVGHIYTTEGNFDVSFLIYDTNTCNISDSIHFPIQVDNDIAIADISVVEHLFSCDSLQLDVHSNTVKGGHFWDFGDGSFSIDSATNHTYLNEGNYTITYILYDSTKACNPYDTAFYLVNFQSFQTDLQISDTIGCIPLDLVYNSSNLGQSYLWNFGNGDFSSNKTGTYTFVNTGTFNISLLVEDTFSCNVWDTAFAQIITEDTRVEAFADFTTLNSCDSLLSIQINNQSINGNVYEWQFDGANIQTVEEPGIFDFTSIGNHTIHLIVRNDSLCNPLDTLVRNFNLLANANAHFNVEDNCENSIIQLENNSSLGSSFIWDFGNGTSSMEGNPKIEYAISGLYTITLFVTDSSTCNITDSYSQEVNIIKEAIADFVTDSINYIYPDDVYFTNLSQNFTNFNWLFGDGSSESENENPIHSYKILYDIEPCLTVWNEFCADSICKKIYIDFQELIGVPNAFSPNGDGINDIIYVEGEGIKSMNFKIYNRWGILVFESNDQSIGWDGTYNGTLQELEVYTYLLDALFINDEKAVLKGNITLMR